ncbi:MAG TPA: hypothetical protein ENN60_00015 [archaeon]|nr:hypothetical protein [archaeon]
MFGKPEVSIDFDGYEASLNWLLANKKQLLKEIGRDKWVAVEKGRVLSKGDDPEQVLTQAMSSTKNVGNIVMEFLTDSVILF